MPSPVDYENIISLSSPWMNLTKSLLLPHFQAKFCPTLGIGGIYLPKFSHKDYCVTGKTINMIPKFRNTI